MIVIGICKCEHSRQSQHNTGIRLLDYMLRRFCGVDNYELKYTDKGKPYTNKAIFSISHSDNQVAVAVQAEGVTLSENTDDKDILTFAINTICVAKSIGVDIQHIEEAKYTAYRSIADKKYFAAERDVLNSCISNTDYCNEFCRMWTLKEAYSKMTGNGLPDALECDTTAICDIAHTHSRVIDFCDDKYCFSVCYNS